MLHCWNNLPLKTKSVQSRVNKKTGIAVSNNFLLHVHEHKKQNVKWQFIHSLYITQKYSFYKYAAGTQKKRAEKQILIW